MKDVGVFLCWLLLCVSASGEGDSKMPSEETVRQLESKGFSFCIRSAGVRSVSEDEMSVFLRSLRTRVEHRIESLVNSNLLAKLEKPYLVAVPGNGPAPDRFVAECAFDNVRVGIVAGEFDTTFNVVPENPKAFSQDEAKGSLVDWYRRLFRTTSNETGLASEVSEAPEFWLVRRTLTDAKGNKKGVAWTWRESVKMALEKHGRWLSISVQNLPETVSSMPAGGMGRATGHWFDTGEGYGQSKNTLKQKAASH